MDWKAIFDITQQAGEKILAIYHDTSYVVEHKKDNSPLTLADQESHNIIMSGLKELYPFIPILSEEGKDIPYEERKEWSKFWLVDPLDGTKEFINRNGEFTVNIALIVNGEAEAGVIYAPVTGIYYFGHKLYKQAFSFTKWENRADLKTKPKDQKKAIIVESRSHPSPELEVFTKGLDNSYNNIERIRRGSSLKFCAVAAGEADYYPRFGPTMEWDTAAGQAIVEAAGGVVETPSGRRLSYNKECLRNGFFIAKRL
ncbi:3'(2'),5'-bisphosphate nucleotidase [Desulfuribacillus alkaliarsenatis]|uniref:3'(2'),5'-bisphosphate nucleotidase CysQ n=1 Tax=Desulfuribacillus alkaliarsenatis TaxID=766136 RepID=A0A1E5G233_9FIRM|nr:3'(2'),5'-bisphosphate nucleotidase [Desulfuribacillus alkaliarsenatis]